MRCPGAQRRKPKQAKRETWPDLPKDILFTILSLLTLRDRTCASAVCKNWYLYAISERTLYKSPLLLRLPREPYRNIFDLYDPSTRKTNYLELPQLRRCIVFAWSIDNWLLSWKPRTLRPFFFNPYTEVSIDLPIFDFSDYFDHMVVFSSSPVHDHCTIFAVKSLYLNIVTISRCDTKTKEWTTYETWRSGDVFSGIFENLIYSNGFLYCQSNNRYLFAYDTKTCKWSLDDVPPPKLPIFFGVNWLRQCKMVAHEGDIYLIYLYCVKEPIVFKLHKMTKMWKRKKNLGGVTFFVSPLSTQARVHASGIEVNNIYFHDVRFYGQNCIRYSLDEKRFYPNKNYSLPKEEEPYRSIWMDPPADDASLM